MAALDTDLYRQAFLATDNPALITDESFRIRDVNEAFRQLGGWEDDELIGRSPLALFDDPQVFEEAADTVMSGEPWTGDFRARTQDGRYHQGRGSVAPLEVDGEVEGYIAFFTDLTESRKQEESLRVLNRVLRHNLRNDANVIMGHLQSLAEEADEGALPRIETAIDRVESMLDRAETTRQFGRLLTESSDPALYPVHLDGAMRQAINPLDTADADFSVAYPDEEVFVLADETVTAAFRSLVDNAVEHTGDNPTVEVSVEVDEESAVVAVEDDGPGVAPARREYIFGRQETEVHHSQGLSLFCVDRLMEIYGGEARVTESELGGSRFELEFRRTAPEEHGLGEAGRP